MVLMVVVGRPGAAELFLTAACGSGRFLIRRNRTALRQARADRGGRSGRDCMLRAGQPWCSARNGIQKRKTRAAAVPLRRGGVAGQPAAHTGSASVYTYAGAESFVSVKIPSAGAQAISTDRLPLALNASRWPHHRTRDDCVQSKSGRIHHLTKKPRQQNLWGISGTGKAPS